MDIEDKGNKKQVPGRMDFIMEHEFMSEDDDTITFKVRMVPDPKRYELLESDGKTAYLVFVTK
jgi:hypothetical protein